LHFGGLMDAYKNGRRTVVEQNLYPPGIYLYPRHPGSGSRRLETLRNYGNYGAGITVTGNYGDSAFNYRSAGVIPEILDFPI